MISFSPNTFNEIPFINGLSYSGFYLLCILGIFQLGIPYILYGKAIKYVSALEATLLPILEPLLNPIWVLLIMQEEPSPLSIIGGIIVVTAITARGIIQSRHIS